IELVPVELQGGGELRRELVGDQATEERGVAAVVGPFARVGFRIQATAGIGARVQLCRRVGVIPDRNLDVSDAEWLRRAVEIAQHVYADLLARFEPHEALDIAIRRLLVVVLSLHVEPAHVESKLANEAVAAAETRIVADI